MKKAKTSKKKKTQKTALIILALILVVLLWWKFIHKKSDSETTEAEIKAASNPSAPAPTSTTVNGLKTLGNDAKLSKGTKSREVKWVQYYYNQMIAIPQGKTKLAEDGIFGPKTEAAVKSVLKKTTTSWTEWKNTLDHLKKVTTSTIASNSNEPSGYSTWALDAIGYGSIIL